MPHIYILELEGNRYFIGRCEDSEDINEKIDDILLGKVKITAYAVKRADKIVRDVMPSDETDCYYTYVKLYGIENVFTDLRCYRCGRPGHYKKNCFTRWHANDFEIED
jgi:hypothetical protein